MPDISRKAGSMDFLPSILKFTKKGFYHWKGFLLLKKLSGREEELGVHLSVPGSSSIGGDLRGAHPLPVINSIEGFTEEFTVHRAASYVPSPCMTLLTLLTISVHFFQRNLDKNLDGLLIFYKVT